MTNRLLEMLLGLDHGFLSRSGEFSMQFQPDWPWQKYTGAASWNFVLGMAALVLVVMVYRREGRSLAARIFLGVLRLSLFAFILCLLNRPVLTLSQSRFEPSVLAILVDDSLSMKVPDMLPGPDGSPMTRLQSVADLIGGRDGELIKQLGKQHVLKFWRFDQAAAEIAGIDEQTKGSKPEPDAPATRPDDAGPAHSASPFARAIDEVNKLQPLGQSTQVAGSIRNVLDQLQGQRVAGVVVLTDGKDVPTENLAETVAAVKGYNIRIYPIAVGSDKAPQNIEVQSVNVQDSAFKGDIVNVKAMIRATGYERGHLVRVQLKDKKTGAMLLDPDGHEMEKSVAVEGDKPQEVELPFKAGDIGTLDFVVEVVKQSGEINESDNAFPSQIDVLDAKINVLYVDGYPRWEYRYIKNEMIREPTIRISCLLQSADIGFAPEASPIPPSESAKLKYFPYKHFPETMEQLLESDVVIFGDVDPQQFSDTQLQVLRDFVANKKGGFGMIAGPRWSPQAFKNTAIQDLLPVTITRVQEEGPGGHYEQGFRPVLTKDGENSSIYRFYADKLKNDAYIRDDIQQIFWYCKGVTVKPNVGEVFAEHPLETGPDGRKAPLMVLGHFGSGRTLFSAIDDSWRWRYYTGESVFDKYWIQQFRYLAREKKLGQRKMTMVTEHPAYEVGQQVKVKLRVLDLELLSQLQDQLSVDIVRNSDGVVLRRENLTKQEGEPDLFTGAYTADQTGKYTARLPSVAPGVQDMTAPVNVDLPGGELEDPRVERKLLSQLVDATDGKMVEFADARAKLPTLIPSAARTVGIDTNQPLWDAPLALAIFLLLITVEWVLRKVFGML